MVNVIPSSGGAPMPMETDFVASNDKNVLFLNFEVGSTTIRQQHDDYIKGILVPFYINQIEALGFRDKRMTLKPVGMASATGNAKNNQHLSEGRAQAIGACIQKYFEAQKSRGPLAKDVTVVIEAIGKGDNAERDLIGPALSRIPPKLLENKSAAYRSVVMSFKLQHVVDDDDTKIFGRQILNVKFTEKTVPANHLEEVINEIDDKMPPELKAALKFFVDALKDLVKTVVKTMLEAAEFLGPEVFIIFKGVEFVFPSEIKLMFEFRDSRGRTKKYKFTGSANKIDINALEVIAQLLSLVKWLTRLPDELQELEEAAKKGGRLNLTHEQIEKIEKAIKDAKKFVSNASKIFDALTAKDSIFRHLFGDELTDMIVAAVNAGKSGLLGDAEVATDWALCSFDKPGVFDIATFGGVARTETNERIGAPSVVALDFAARSNQSLLGFQGHLIVERKWTPSLSLRSFEISNGNLIPTV